METLITENMENAPMLPVVSTETTETLEQLPPSVTNMQAPETSLPEVTNSETTENLDQTALLEVTNTNETAPFDEPTPPPAANIQTTETLDQSTVPLLEITEITVTMEQSVIPLEVTDNSHENVIAFPENHQGVETRLETTEEEEEVRSVLKVIAETGKFWYDWEKLRSMLSLHLKQVISEYPQAKMSPEEQKVSLGETHAELVKRLDDALLSFVDGPPFTLQRLSEIILDARSMYPNLSKLALALEKNLSVTSTLTMSTNPYPSSVITTRNELNKVIADPIPSTNSQMQFNTVIENGVLPEAADNDEIMTEVDADVSDVMTMEVETNESPMTTDIVGSSRVLVQPTGLSKLSSSSTFILQQNSNQFAISKISTEGENVACHDQIEFRQQTP